MRDALVPLLGERDSAGEFIFPLPSSARIDTLILGCTHDPLLRPAITVVAGARIAIVDSDSATASPPSERMGINGLGAPGITRGRAADAGRLGHDRLDEDAARPSHGQPTTGDLEAFRTIARRLFGDAFPEIEGVELRHWRVTAGQPLGREGRS